MADPPITARQSLSKRRGSSGDRLRQISPRAVTVTAIFMPCSNMAIAAFFPFFTQSRKHTGQCSGQCDSRQCTREKAKAGDGARLMQKKAGNRLGQRKQSDTACHTKKKTVPDHSPYHTADRFSIDRTGRTCNPRATIRRQPHGRKRKTGQRDGHRKSVHGHHKRHQSHRFRTDFPGNIRLKAHADHTQ